MTQVGHLVSGVLRNVCRYSSAISGGDLDGT
jgi:hypothetical protein